MDTQNKPLEEKQQDNPQQAARENVKNPFENGQSAENDISQSQEDINNEQQFKEALTERD